MAIDLPLPEAHVPQIQVFCYGVQPPHNTKITFRTILAVESERIQGYRGLPPGAIVEIPDDLSKLYEGPLCKERQLSLDQVAKIHVVENGEVLARFFVEGVQRKDVDHGPNAFRPYCRADRKWVTVEEYEAIKGIFEMSDDIPAGEYGTKPGMKKYVIGPGDRVVQPEGNDFLVINPLAPIRLMPVSAGASAQPR